jgi:hypothetical protein
VFRIQSRSGAQKIEFNFTLSAGLTEYEHFNIPAVSHRVFPFRFQFLPAMTAWRTKGSSHMRYRKILYWYHFPSTMDVSEVLIIAIYSIVPARYIYLHMR